jgi:hypothetical protein
VALLEIGEVARQCVGAVMRPALLQTRRTVLTVKPGGSDRAWEFHWGALGPIGLDPGFYGRGSARSKAIMP